MYRPYAEADGTIIWPHHSTIHTIPDEFAEWAKRTDSCSTSGDACRGSPMDAEPGRIVPQRVSKRSRKSSAPNGSGWITGNRMAGISGSRIEDDLVTRCRFDQYSTSNAISNARRRSGNRLRPSFREFRPLFPQRRDLHLIEAETAQALPNSQVYSWIRGAGKQYGVLCSETPDLQPRGFKSYPNQIDQGRAQPDETFALFHIPTICRRRLENGWFSETS